MRSSDLLALVSTKDQPRGDRLIVLPLRRGSRGTLLDMEENRERPERGIVLAAGPGTVGAETGRTVPVLARPGELVAYGRYAGLAFEADGPHGAVDVFIMRDAEVLLAQPADSVELVIHEDNPNKVHLAGLLCDSCPQPSGEERLQRLREVAAGGHVDAAIDEERARAVETAGATV